MSINNDLSIIKVDKLPPSMDKALENVSDGLSKEIGNSLSGIWFLVFGGIHQQAELKRMKYAHDLKQLEETLSKNISNIPKEKIIEPDMQIAAQALENSKYCLSSQELRNMFANLVANTMNSDYSDIVHPSFPEIIKQMSPYDAKVLKEFVNRPSFPMVNYRLKVDNNSFHPSYQNIVIFPNEDLNLDFEKTSKSIFSLIRLGLLESPPGLKFNNEKTYEEFKKIKIYDFLNILISSYPIYKGIDTEKCLIQRTTIGASFIKSVIE